MDARKFQDCNAYCTVRKDPPSLCLCGRKNGRREEQREVHVEKSLKSGSGGTNSTSVISGNVWSARSVNESDQEIVRIFDLSMYDRTVTRLGEISTLKLPLRLTIWKDMRRNA